MRFPGIYHEEVRRLYGEIGHLTDMGRVCLGTSLHIIALQIGEVDELIVEDAIHAAYGKLLIDAVDRGLDVFLTLIEIVLVN